MIGLAGSEDSKCEGEPYKFILLHPFCVLSAV